MIGTDQLEMIADSDFKTGDILYCEPPFMTGTIHDKTTEFKLVDLTRYMDVLFPRFTIGMLTIVRLFVSNYCLVLFPIPYSLFTYYPFHDSIQRDTSPGHVASEDHK